ncbi:MAG: DNA replication/repair protein RecF [Lysobacteraceae bacterium]
MRVTRLQLSDMRRFAEAELLPGPRLNLITGDNGAGKTTLLEALHLMAYGRSFRGRVRDGLIRQGAPALEVFVEWEERAPASAAEGVVGLAGAGPGDGHHDHIAEAVATRPRRHRAGLRHTGSDWTGRLDGAGVCHLGELCAALAVVTFEPGSHALVTGGSEGRRRLLDWGLFHVEPEFLTPWRRYARALKQRNALLKTRAVAAQLEPWEQELAASGEAVTRYRDAHVASWEPLFRAAAVGLLPAAGEAGLAFLPGWRREELSLADALLLSRERDLASGFTSVGPHRADWRIDFTHIPGREALSRGQAKLAALALLLSQAEHHARLRGAWPVVALDDLASELDRAHQRRVLDWLLATGAQLFVTGTEPPPALAGLQVEMARFHVEQGRLRPEA